MVYRGHSLLIAPASLLVGRGFLEQSSSLGRRLETPEDWDLSHVIHQPGGGGAPTARQKEAGVGQNFELLQRNSLEMRVSNRSVYLWSLFRPLLMVT